MRGRRRRVIDVLRRELPGAWQYDRDMHEWIRADGVRVYARAHVSIGVNGGESYYSRWYVEYPVHGPVVKPRSFPGSFEHACEWWAFEHGALPGYIEDVYFLR